MEIDDLHLIQQTPGFRDLESRVVEALLEKTTRRSLQAGEHLFETGQEFLEEVYILCRGSVELHRSDGRIERSPPGYLLGLSSYLSESPYASTAMALDAAEVLVLGAADLRRLEGEHPTFFDAINRLIAVGLRERSISASATIGALVQPARSIMSAPLKRCSRGTTLREALDAMLASSVGSLAVVEPSGALEGIVTYRSLAQRMAHQGADPDRDPVAEALMPVKTIAADTPLWQAQDKHRRSGRPCVGNQPACPGGRSHPERNSPGDPTPMRGAHVGGDRVRGGRHTSCPVRRHHHGLGRAPGDDARSGSGQRTHPG
jgi:signal-transduction protein with cAMP-binding, CBS, and nucleotidyltransferase domain